MLPGYLLRLLTRHVLCRVGRAAAMTGLCVSTTLPTFAAPSVASQLTTNERRHFGTECVVVIELLQGYHLSDRPFADIKAAELLETFATRLDPARMTLTAADLTFIKRRFERNLKTVYLFKGDLHPAFEIFDLFAKRADARIAWVEKRLGEPFDLSEPATFESDRDKAAWPEDERAADRLWEQRLKAELIGWRILGLSDADAVVEMRRSFSEFREHFDSIDALVVRERFMDAMLASFDPHSGYFRHDAAVDFDKELSTVSAGIGLTIAMHEKRAYVRSIDRGSPADRQGGIRVGDEIVSVANGDDPATALSGRPMRELLQLLTAKPGSTLTLSVQPWTGGTARTISLLAEEFPAVEYRARAALYRVPGPHGDTPVGMITIPAFYGQTSASEKKAGASVSSDVAELLGKLTSQGAKGVVIDLRGNGGGLMGEAVKLSGLFLRKAPILAARGMDGKVTVMSDDDATIAYTGPLVVLTSPASASASEAFSGALQHYKRALIVGSKSTYGKGTAQGFIDLKRMQGSAGGGTADWGMVRVTQQYFYLPDGRSPQQVGVLSDVILPDIYDWSKYQEASLPHAMPSKTIDALTPMDGVNPTEGAVTLTPAAIDALRAASVARQTSLPEFQLARRMTRLSTEGSRTNASLDLAQRQREHDEANKEVAALRAQRRELRQVQSFQGSYVETASVAEAERRHQAALKARLPELADGEIHFDGRCVYQHIKHAGRILEISAGDIDFLSYLPEAASLAEVWTRATGATLTTAQVSRLLTELSRQTDPGPTETVSSLFARYAGDAVDEKSLQAGVTAVLARVFSLDPLPHPGAPSFDVQRRECLRLAVDWAGLLSTSYASQNNSGSNH